MESERQSLYRFFDGDGNLLYIGITNCLPRRLGDHERYKSWFSDVASVSVETFPNRESVLAAEKAAIRAESPMHNVVHSTKMGPRSRPRTKSGAGRWTFESRRSGIEKTADLFLYPELDCSSMVDDYYDECGETQLEAYIDYLRRHHPEWLDGNAVPIGWSVVSERPSGVFEAAPFDGYLADGLDMDFLTYFTWPVDERTGEEVHWFDLPVRMEWRFPEFARALRWRPSAFQPSCPLLDILDSLNGVHRNHRPRHRVT